MDGRAGHPDLSACLGQLHSGQTRGLYFSPVHNLLYVSNQKAGCTSLKYSLWMDCDRRSGKETYGGKTHTRVGTPFVFDPIEIAAAVGNDTKVFSVVRNPFARVLSVYLHHVVTGGLWARMTRLAGVWRSSEIRDDFFAKVGLNSRSDIDFETFLKALRDIEPDYLSGHFRPQVRNLAWGALPYDFIGRLEDLVKVESFLEAHDIPLIHRKGHAQNAARKMSDYMTTACERLIVDHFVEDFEAFGYVASWR